MTDYKLYRNEKHISNTEMVDAIKPEFPGFSKIQASMVQQPLKYGLCLLPEAEAILIEKYGQGLGLETGRIDSVYSEPEEPVKKVVHRRKRNRLAVRLTDEMYRKVMIMMYKLNFNTVQDFLEATLQVMVERENNEE